MQPLGPEQPARSSMRSRQTSRRSAPQGLPNRQVHRLPTQQQQHRRRRWTRWRGARDESGSVSAELVVATPILLLLILCVVQFAIWEHACHVADAVADQGLATARLQGESPAAGTAEARLVLDELGTGVLDDASITATQSAAETTVVVTGRAESVVGIFHLPVRAVASGPTEIYTVVPGP